MNLSRAGQGVRAGVAALAVLGAGAALVAAAAPAGAAATFGAAGPLSSSAFGLVPSALPSGQQRSYFQFSVAAGRSARDFAVISNQSGRTERLRIILSKGVTATNSGSAYVSVAGPCVASTCWVSGLARTVTLAPGARQGLPFRLAVPPGTRPGQYLAGITAEAAATPRSVRLGTRGHSSARAIIIDQVTVGVAVTVGPLARLRTSVRVAPVAAAWIGTTPRLSIPVSNTGQTFVRATGPVTCRQDGRRRSYPAVMETVLPGGGAVLAVNAAGLRAGTIPCSVRLRDAAGQVFAWSGPVHLASRVETRTYHTAKGVYVTLPHKSVPGWAIALMVIGALVIVGLAVLLLRRRRGGPPAHRGRPSGLRG